MPPKTAPVARTKPAGRGVKGRGKGNKNKQKRHKLKLKGWLKTAADWARFDAWAKINALPRKIPEPETTVRVAKPLSHFKKRLLVISQPAVKSDPGLLCRLDLSVSKAALKAKASKRTKELAIFIWKDEDCGREFPTPIPKAALNYNASPRIIEIAKPHIHETPSCRDLEISKKALEHKTTKWEKKMSSAKKARMCPEALTDEEMAKLLTPGGIKKSALNYKITDWVSVLAIPSYRFLKDRRDSDAKEMKKRLEESDSRGKKVLDEQRKKEEEEAEKKAQKNKKNKKEVKKDQKAGAGDKAAEKPSDEDGSGKDKSEKDKKREEKEEKMAKERKKWRKEPGPCKLNLGISKAALNATASPRTEEIAKPHIHISKSCRQGAFAVKKSALQASASERVTQLAEPAHPSDPVERPPPRKKDEYGMPIFPKPKYGKRLPKAKPYKQAECKDADDENKDKEKDAEKRKEEARKKKLESIPLFPSIDPIIDPKGAKKQAEARKAAEEKKKAEKEKKK